MSENKVKVSIIIPVYNAEKYLRICLDSIINQTLKEIEIILVDDGSTDSSAEICKSYLNDSRIKFITQKNQGAYGARQKGLDQANGEYIGFVDADDWIEPEMFGRMYTTAFEKECDIVMCGMYKDKKKYHHHFEHGLYENEKIDIIIANMLSVQDDKSCNCAVETWSLCSKIYRADLIKQIKFSFDKQIKNGQDLLFNLHMLFFAKKVFSLSDENYYHWREENNSFSDSRKYRYNCWNNYKSLIKKIDVLLEKYHFNDCFNSKDCCFFFISSIVLHNEWVYTELKKSEIIKKLDELAKEPIIKEALINVPREKLNNSYQSDYDALMCTSGEEMYRVLKNHSYYKKFRRPIRMKRKLSKYKLFTFVYPKFRKKLIKLVKR